MKILLAVGKHNYGDPARGISYEYSNFLPALKKMGNEVVHFETWNKTSYKDYAELNKQFLLTVQREQPDLIFCVLMHYEIWTETLEQLRAQSDSILINWGTDDSWKYEQFSRWTSAAFHVYATTSRDALYKANIDGNDNFVLTQWAANSGTMAEPLPASDCEHSVSFIGSAYGNRRSWVERLKKAGVEVECYGYGWENGVVKSEDIPRIIRRSVVSLNFGDSGLHLGKHGLYRSRQIKARIFEVPGAGGCLVTEEAPDLSDYYALDKEIVVFRDLSGLESKLKELLDNPKMRDDLAIAGYLRTARDHTYERRFEELFSIAEKLRNVRPDAKKRKFEFSNDWWAGIERKYHTGRVLRLTRLVTVAVFSLFFGRRRGARGARRMVYELSWRLAGKKTFSVSGLPGRLFYKES